MDKPTILFDHRDKDDSGYHDWAEQTREELSVRAEISIGHLKLGDISWLGAGGRPHLAEIKHAGDLEVSLRTEHLQDQMTRMIAWNEEGHEGKAGIYLFIVGRISGDENNTITFSRSDWQVPVFKGGGLSVALERGKEEVFWEQGYRPYPMYVSYMVSLQESGIVVLSFAPNQFGRTFGAIWRRTVRKPYNRRVRRATVLSPEQQSLLALSPSLNQAASKKLLDEFGTFRDVIFQEIDTLVQISGVGPVTAKEIVDNGTRSHS